MASACSGLLWAAAVAAVTVALCAWEVTAGPALLKNGGYDGVIVAIDDSVPADNCRAILNNLEISLAGASQFLHAALEGRAYLRTVTVLLPDAWADSCSPRYVTTSSGETADIRVSVPHPVFGDSTWTQQSQGCGQPGDFIYLSYRQLLEGKNLARSLVREWTKYRYGVFDETGYHGDSVYPTCYYGDQNKSKVTGCSDLPIADMGICDDPNLVYNTSNMVHADAKSSIMFASESPHITKFCDSQTHNKHAPTKHNLICERRSVMDVILQHPDFINSVGDASVMTNTTPSVLYKKRKLTRYVLVVEETMAMHVRESWVFLRTAVRKWLVYDLPANTEVGLVLCNETASNRVHRLSELTSVTTRDFLAATIPYTPGESHSAGCLHCGVREALDMLKDRATIAGPASSVVIIIAPGMDHVTELNALLPRAVSFGVRLVTINYPNIARSAPLNSLAHATGGEAFTVQEQRYNMATSYVTTYFKLANILFSIASQYYEGRPGVMPIEVHRRELSDDGRSSVTGSFVLEESLGEPAQFNVYTHNSEMPLIRRMSLTSPSQIVYSRRSDSLLSFKMLTLPANLNETGTWTYEIERFPGNPQPHFVQVMATPRTRSSLVVRARAWTSEGKTPLILYTEVKRGDYPVLGARVEVIATYPGKNGSGAHRDKFELLDTGSGDPDITKGDGVYSRYFTAQAEGMYTFEISVMDNGNTAYSWQDIAVSEPYSECCGSVVPTPAVQPLSPFQRILPPTSAVFGPEDISIDPILGRIGDLRARIIPTDLKARLTWTAPDVGSTPVSHYEIRYAHSLSDIIEHYDSVGQIWNYGTPFPLTPGSETTFTLDFTRNPSLLDLPLYIRMRAFAESIDGPASGPISNWVYVMVPSPPPPPPPPTTLPTSTFDISSWPNENTDAASVLPGIAQAENFGLELILPIVGGLALLTICLIVYCYICILRRRHGNSDKKQKGKDKHTSNGKQQVTSPSTPVTIMPSSPGNISNGNSNNSIAPPPQPDSMPPQYEATISEEKKRFSVSQLQQEEQMLQQQHEQLLQQQRDMTPHVVALPSTNSVSGISTISNGGSNTITRGGRTLSPYQSWTASQLLHEHERRHSPYGGRADEEVTSGNGGNQMPPPVPPLPAYTASNNAVYSSGPIYGVHPGTFSTSAGYHRNGSLVPFNPSLQGSLSSVSSGDRKKRNVTMV
ncbi:calcium-activated chloride channel regulator 1-like [Schistocerca piceifrons]|uniref:calcium-activated chloride channel regulator 1-like n=1 Tax=Schistocerca piceifrons TaxID=274613 RepID=UPI001F5EF80C|nr:calcium-activated chloride channel regulator 1-like [Schistocerca piceifrons]